MRRTRPVRVAVRVAVAVALIATLTGCAAGSGEDPSAPGSPAPEPERPVPTDVAFEFDGVERSYRVTAPADTGDEPLPVLVALHGAGGSAATLGYVTGFDLAVANEGFLLVEPNGTGPDQSTRTWNAGTCCGTSAGAVDDVGFLAELLDRVAAEHPVDEDRIYLAGFSNGGMLAYRAACELGERIAGIAVVAGTMNVEDCPAPSPVPVLAIHGADDAVVPYRGGQASYNDPRVEPWYNEPVEESVAFWAERNGCTGDPFERTVDDAVVREWDGCAVTLWVVQGGRHTWFGGPMSAARGLEPAGAPSATELTLRFFGLNRSGG